MSVRAVLSSAVLIAVGPCLGAGLSVSVTDLKGVPLEDAAVYLEPTTGRVPPLRARGIEIEQKSRKFTQLMTVVQVGQAIAFPNNDTVRHHVYSLSQAKLFELKLYSGVPEAPVVFDKAGTVIVGCNIHDKMVAYIRIVDTPWFGKTDAAGRVTIDGFPDGQYRLRTWHHAQPNLDQAAEQVVTARGDNAAVAVRLDMKGVAK